jgi:hypothetical protein
MKRLNLPGQYMTIVIVTVLIDWVSKAALTWLKKNGKTDSSDRFDVIAILLPDHDVSVIDHIRAAVDLAY